MPVRLTKGSFELYEPRSVMNRPKFTVRFLFNPDKITRKVTPTQAESAGGTSSGRQDLKSAGFPAENITLSIMLDASVLVDEKIEIERGNPTVQRHGIMPILTALQWLIFPTPSGGQPNSGGANHVPKYDSPYVIFVWDSKTRLPVKITSLNITEQEFGPNLMPIRAEVQISMDVITSDDTKLPDFIKDTYLTTTLFRQQMVDMYKSENFSLT
jgi:hypothetical protein